MERNSEREPRLKICYDRIVPSPHPLEAKRIDALLRATKKATPRDAFRDLDPSKPLGVAFEAVITQKRWPVGSTLRCRFLEGSGTQQAKVIAKAQLWQDYANIKITFVDDNEDVRIGFRPDQGSWSAIGTDSHNAGYFPVDQPTMNFGWLEDDTDDVEYERVVVHEFGHALGCIHEHQSPNEHLKWNVEKVYAQFSGPPNNWTKAKIDQNILEKYSPNGITATVFDPESIMLYQFPAELFTDGVATPLNTKLSAKDKALIAQMYPAT